MPEEDLVELKFRLYDGSDIGPFQYSPTSTIGMVKERIVAEWPKGEDYFQYAINHVKRYLRFFSGDSVDRKWRNWAHKNLITLYESVC